MSSFTTNSFLALVSSVEGTDKCLRLAVYTLRLMSVLLSPSLTFLRFIFFLKLSHCIASKRPLPNNSAENRLNALIDIMVDSRVCLRFFGTFAVIYRFTELLQSWSQSHWKKHLHSNIYLNLSSSILKPITIRLLQAIALVAYYPLEQIYFLGRKGVIPIQSLKQICGYSRASNLAWFLYLGLETISNVHELGQLSDEINDLKEHSGSQIEKDNCNFSKNSLRHTETHNSGKKTGELCEDLKYLLEQKKLIQWNLLGTIADLPLSLSLSLENPILHPLSEGLCGMVSSIMKLKILHHQQNEEYDDEYDDPTE
ncbi:hypothetical protein HK096_006662 [Nowakowskiella sp. JEL0078]|nr:hypothetical protein HK096_006662 [Nowakowskiella sp. JEL0078]